MSESGEKRRPYQGPVLFSLGFRPFFFLAGLLAATLLPIWVMRVTGLGFENLQSLTSLWHAHELLYGFVASAVAGFILTAVPNWTGRAPMCGWPLGTLVALWIAGRAVMFAPDILGAISSAIVDAAFLPVLAILVGREILAGKNKRNLPVVLMIALFAGGNIAFHLQQLNIAELDDFGLRLGVAAMILLLSLIGGRIVPSFTENWLVSQNMGGRVIGFNSYDKIVLLLSAIVMAGWLFSPYLPFLWMGFAVLAGLHFYRLSRWGGWLCGGEFLVLFLHIAYLWLPLGFVAMAVELHQGWGNNIGIHALTAGAMANMIVAVMTRATLGHSGRALQADAVTTLIYLMVALGALVRVCSFFATDYVTLLHVSAGLWSGGFTVFVVYYGRMHFSPRVPN